MWSRISIGNSFILRSVNSLKVFMEGKVLSIFYSNSTSTPFIYLFLLFAVVHLYI